MASIKEIVQMEGERSEPGQYRRIELWHEGSFLRAYEWSAWLLCRFVHEFKVTRRQFKGVEQSVTFVGFPLTSLAKFVPEGCEVREEGEKHTVMELPMSLGEDEVEAMRAEFAEWHEGIPLSVPATKEKTASQQVPAQEATRQPRSLTEVMHAILAFPVERKSPIDCMMFLTETKAQLATLI